MSETFDVVVVGGGVAGCVVAARLSASGSRSVLLLEAGPDPRSDPPEGLRDGFILPKRFDWGLRSEPDDRGEAQALYRGKVLGGTGWETRFALRGSPADYDRWAALGNAGWGWADVLPFFTRLEADADFGAEPWHGDHGPIPIDRYLDRTPGDAVLATREALMGSGFAWMDDHNRPGAVGVGSMPMSSRDGVRCTTVDGYFPTEPRSNLTIRTDMPVAEILLEGTRATGVRTMGGSTVAAGQVVLCAGTYGSPVLLMRSGVGRAGSLRSAGVDVRVDLPGVGANLADHPGVDLELEVGGSRGGNQLHTVATWRSSHASDADAPDLMFWIADPSGDPRPARVLHRCGAADAALAGVGDVALGGPRGSASDRAARAAGVDRRGAAGRGTRAGPGGRRPTRDASRGGRASPDAV
jgi:choline dehydrogenase